MDNKKWMVKALGIILILGIIIIWRNTNTEKQIEANFVFIAPKNWNRIASGVLQADRDFNTNTKYILYNQDDEEKQAEAIEYAWMSGADGIITAGLTDAVDVEDTIQKVQASGVPVVFVDSDLNGSSRSCYLGSDNYQVGYLAGDALKSISAGKARICLIVSYNNNMNMIDRRTGLEAAIADNSDMKIVSVLEGKSEALLIREKLSKALQDNPEIDTIVCAEGVSVNCCSEILEGNGLDPEIYNIVGMHYSEFNYEQLMNGFYDALVYQDQYQMGYEAVRYLKDLQDGITRDESTIYTELCLATKNNMDKKLQWQQEDIEWNIF